MSAGRAAASRVFHLYRAVSQARRVRWKDCLFKTGENQNLFQESRMSYLFRWVSNMAISIRINDLARLTWGLRLQGFIGLCV